METGQVGKAEDKKTGKAETKEEEKKKAGEMTIPGLRRAEEQSRWTEYRFASKLPERRSYLCSCVYKQR